MRYYAYVIGGRASYFLSHNSIPKIELASKSYGTVAGNTVKICRGGIDNCYDLNHNENRTLKSFYDTGDSYVDFSRGRDGALPDNVGDDKKEQYFSDLGLSYTMSSAYYKYGVGINIYRYNKIGIQGDSNNTWPSFDNKAFGIGSWRTRDCSTIWNGAKCNGKIFKSISRPDRCSCITPDEKMWYVFVK